MTREEAIQILRTRIVPTRNWQEIHEAVDMAIEALQTDLVRCKDCRYYNPIDENKPYPCGYGMYMCNKDDFCSYGERQCNYFGERREK